MNLYGLSGIDEAERRAIARRSLNNLLTSYADEADLFNEIVQNAADALIEASRDGLFSKTADRPKLRIVIGRRSGGHHYLFVADNGVGMSPSVAQNITVPGFSSGKKKGKTIGYKGVGASYFFAASQKISLRTIDATGTLTEYTVRGSYEWIRNDEEPEPSVELKSDVPESIIHLLPDTRGTSIFFQFHDGIRPKDLNGLVIVGQGTDAELKNWMCFLASKTALGIVEKIPELDADVELYLDLGDTLQRQTWKLGDFDRENLTVGYPFPHRVFRVAKSVREIEATPQEQRYKHARKYSAVFERWTAAEIIEQTSLLDAEERDKLLQHLAWVDGYLCYSTDVLKEVNQRLGGRGYLVRHGMRIAVDQIPQGRNIDLSLTSSQGLDRQSHLVLSFTGLELDTGRKISADEVIGSAISKLGQRVVAILKEYRWAMKKKDRPDVTSDLETWRSSVDARSQTSLVGELFRSASLAPVFRVDPDNESEVIALFVSLIGHDLLHGYTIDAISGYARYDCLCDVDSKSPIVRNLEDTLSVRNVDNAVHGKSKVLEFKYSFDDLIEDFDDKNKNPGEIDFVVCWTLPDLNVRRGRIEPTYGDWRDTRAIYGGTYIWFDENETSEIPILALKHIVAELLARFEKGPQMGIGKATLVQMTERDKQALV